MEKIIEALIQNLHLIIFSATGGMILAGIKLTEHFNRPPENKMTVVRYVVFFVCIVTFLPILGSIVTAMYIANGDKISSLLAFQVGLTSPAIVQSMIIVATNNLANKRIPITDSRQ